MIPKLNKLINEKSTMLKTRVRKGIPSGIRLKVWPILADIDTIKNKNNIIY